MKVQIATMALAVTAASGCAGNANRTAESHPVTATYQSAKTPLAIAECMQKATPGLTTEVSGNQLIVENKNQFGTILMAWYLRPNDVGSTIEVRRAQRIAPGLKKAEACF